MNENRKHYIDNIRWITVCIVMLYHIIYNFNCSGVIKNIGVDGIPILDTFLIFVYPWFMCLLFLVAGISSKYSLAKRTNKEFIKDRTIKLLVPSIVGTFAYGWIAGGITSTYVGMFNGEGAQIPGAIRYLITCLMGTGPLWFCHVLYLASLLLVLVRKIDKKDKLSKLGEKCNILVIFALVVPVFLSSYILNLPLISVYRFGIYFLMFFMGYYIFSNDEIINKLEKISIPLILISFVTGLAYVYFTYGTNYTENKCLQSVFTNVYLWIAILGILGFAKKYLNFSNKFTSYMTKNNFNFYIVHYSLELAIAYFVVTCLHLPFVLNYVVILLGTIIFVPLISEILQRIPIVNKLILGIYKK